MAHWTEKRNTNSVSIMTDVAQKYGISKEACLKNTGISSDMLLDPQVEITGAQELKLIENIVDASNYDHSLALEAGSHYHLTTYGIWGFAFTSSPTLRSATEIGLQYLSLTFAFSSVKIEEEGEYATLYLSAEHVPLKLRRFIIDRDASAMMNIHRELFTHPMPIEETHLQWPTPKDTSEYENAYSIKPIFEQQENRSIFLRSLLDLPLPTANEATQQLLLAQCQNLLERRSIRSGTAHSVRQRLLANIDKAITMDEIAKELCVSPRTLRRQLTAESTSFRSLQDEVRETLACELIQSTNLSMEEIAVRIGYSDTANFFHAFKRWKGITPASYRQQPPV